MKVKVDSFLKAENLEGATSKSPIAGVILSVKFIEAKELAFKSEEGRFELRVLVGDDEYDWMANKTSLKSIIAAFGDESDNWLKKEIKLYAVEQNVSGDIKQVVYAAADVDPTK